MTFTVELLRKLWHDAIMINVEDETIFSHINTVHTKFYNDDLNHLFTVIYEINPTEEGWYEEPIDRRLYFPKIINDKPNWTFLTDSEELTEKYTFGKFILVKNIKNSLKKLYSHILSIVKAKVVGVTGSVGKTTSVSMLESIISSKYKCLRIYSKRITPYVLYSFIINGLEIDTDFIIMEYSLYKKDHISKLSEMLTPDIGLILNIKKLHIDGVQIQNRLDILEGKLKMFSNETIAIFNFDDDLLSQLVFKINFKYSLHDDSVDASLIKINENELMFKFRNEIIIVVPYILTKLYVQQVLATYIIAKILRIESKYIVERINYFVPKENRLIKKRFREITFFIDSENTYIGRIDELSKNYYNCVILILMGLDAMYDYEFSIENFMEITSSFAEVRILQGEKNFSFFETIDTNIKFYNIDNIIRNISENSVCIIHSPNSPEKALKLLQ